MSYADLDFNEELGIKRDDNVWNPAVAGESVVGKLIEKTPNVGKYKQLKIVLENEMGETLTIFCQTVLANLMKEAEVGDILKIVYEGYVPDKNYNMYKVYRANLEEENVDD